MQFKQDIIISDYRSWNKSLGDKIVRNAEATILLKNGKIAKVIADGDLGWDESMRGKPVTATFEVLVNSQDFKLFLKLSDFEPA